MSGQDPRSFGCLHIIPILYKCCVRYVLLSLQHSMRRPQTLSNLTVAERPFHFSILTLAIAGCLLTVWSRLIVEKSARYEHLRSANPKASGPLGTLKTFLLLRASPSFALLTISIVARTVIYWRTIRTIHCSWDGVQVRHIFREGDDVNGKLTLDTRPFSLLYYPFTISSTCAILYYRKTDTRQTVAPRGSRLLPPRTW